MQLDYRKGREETSPANQLRLFGVTSLVQGLVLLLLGIPPVVLFIANRGMDPVIESARHLSGADLSVFFPLVVVALSALAALHGLVCVGRGISYLPAMVVRGDVPRGFRKDGHVAECLEGRRLAVEDGHAPTPIRILSASGVLSQRALLLTPLTWRVARTIVHRVKGRAIWCVVAIVTIAAVAAFSEFIPFAALALLTFAAIAVALLVLVAIDGALVFGMLPSTAPAERVDYRMQQEAGSHKPEMLLDYFEDAARRAETDDLPNTLRALPFSDTTNHQFGRRVLIERRPRPIAIERNRPALLALFLGSAGTLVGWAVLVLGARELGESATVAAACAAFGLLMMSGATGLKSTAKSIFSIYRFESLVTLAILRGSTSESKVHVGKGRDDSVLSENTAFRTELLATYFSSRIISETATLLGEREVVEMRTDEETGLIPDRISALLREKIRGGIVIAHPDTTDESLQRVVHLNAAMPALRKAALDGKIDVFPRLDAGRAAPSALPAAEPSRDESTVVPETAGAGPATIEFEVKELLSLVEERLASEPESGAMAAREAVIPMVEAARELLHAGKDDLAMRMALRALKISAPRRS